METLEKSRVCRLCGKHSGISIDIFDKNDNHFKKINAILPILVHEMDLLPKHICHRCSYKLEEFHKFYIECLKTDTALKNQLSWMCKDTENKNKKTNGVPMVQIENVKIKCEPHEIDPLLESVGLVEIPINGIESELPLLYTTFTNTSRCQYYCDKSNPTGKEAISKDCTHIHLPRRSNFTYHHLNENQESTHESDIWKKQEANIFGSTKELHTKTNITVDSSLTIRNLRPRKRSVDYVGTKRKNPSSDSMERRPQSTEPTTIILSNDLIKNEPLDVMESSRTLRPRKQLKTESKNNNRSKSADRCRNNRSKSKSRSDILELKIKREIDDEMMRLDLRLDDVCSKGQRKEPEEKQWRELYIGIERTEHLRSDKIGYGVVKSHCDEVNKNCVKKSVSRCEQTFDKSNSADKTGISGGKDVHGVGKIRFTERQSFPDRQSLRNRESVGKDRQSFSKEGYNDSKDNATSKESVNASKGYATISASNKYCSVDATAKESDTFNATSNAINATNNATRNATSNAINAAKNATINATSNATSNAASNATNKGSATINTTSKGSATNNSTSKDDYTFNKCDHLHSDTTPKDKITNFGHTFTKDIPKGTIGTFIKDGAIGKNITKDRNTFGKSDNTFRGRRSSRSESKNESRSESRSVSRRNSRSVSRRNSRSNSRSISRSESRSDNTFSRENTNSSSDNNTFSKNRNKNECIKIKEIEGGSNIQTERNHVKKNGSNFLKNRLKGNSKEHKRRLKNSGILKEAKLSMKRLPMMQYSPKNLRSQDLYLRNGKVKVNNHSSQKNFRSKDVRISFLEKFNETQNNKLKSKFLNLDVKHLCEKCNYTFANKELFRLHACYSN